MSATPYGSEPYGAEPYGGGGPGRPSPDERTSSEDTFVWVARLLKVLVFFIYAVIIAGLVILTLGFVLRLFGASTDAEFTRWVYRNDDRIMEPFRGMFPTETVGDHSVIDFSLLFGMIFYSIIAVLLHATVTWLSTKLSRLVRGQDLWA